MNPVRHIPTENELDIQIGLLSTREVLGAYEAITLIQALIIPLLRRAGHDCGDLSEYAGECAVVSAQEELSRLIRLEEQSLVRRETDPADKDHPEWPRMRVASVRLMHLVAEMRIHNDIAIV